MKPSRTDRRRGSPRSAASPAPADRARRADRDAPPPAIADDAAERGARALLATLAALAVLRAAFAYAPGTWLWPLIVMRFLTPAAAWGPWGIAAAVLVPPLARFVLPAFAAAGEMIARRAALAAFAWAAAAAVLVALLPDQVRFVGDFLLRQGTVEVIEQPAVLFPQALPLDVFLHYTVPLQITATHLLDANGAARLLGAIEAALLAALAVAFARALALRGAAACACAAVVLFGGYLGMFTGFSKAFAEMCVLIALIGVSAVRALRTGRGLLPLGIAAAIAIALHRSALGVLPAVALV
ncbi:MAG: hypothetical protein HYR74_07810, partial [Candidatus Eisenbacteria bacterium]|nr:hypothetical protein [Candidatus Eisenbacteria bacterium]